MTSTGVYWPVGANTIKTLDTLPGGSSVPNAISADGSVIVGVAYDAQIVAHPARWDNGALTPLAPVAGITQASRCSDDATIIIGSGSNALCYWTGGGTTGHLLPPAAGDTATAASVFGGGRLCSADGSIIVGFSFPSRVPMMWVNGVPTVLGSAAYSITSISADGSLIVGTLTVGGANESPVYWKAGTWYQLNVTNPSGLGILTLWWANANGTVMYGRLSDTNDDPVYWDNLSTLIGSNYGVQHNLDLGTLGNSQLQFASSEDSNVTVGFGLQSTPTTVDVGQKWTGTALTILPGGVPTDVSGDGTVISGNLPLVSGPCYWDSTNTNHVLPTLGGPGQTDTTGISRNGAVIFGISDAPTPPPPFPKPTLWTITSKLASPSAGGVGDQWMDQSYVDFSNVTTRRKFINADKTWVSLGFYGEVPTGTSPLVWNTVHTGSAPSDFVFGWGQQGGAAGWNVVTAGVDPTTGVAYPLAMSFDICPPTPPPPPPPLSVPYPASGPPYVMLRWSDDGGRTWSDTRIMGIGQRGATNTTVKFNRLGSTRRFRPNGRVFELSSDDPFLVAILGADVDGS